MGALACGEAGARCRLRQGVEPWSRRRGLEGLWRKVLDLESAEFETVGGQVVFTCIRRHDIVKEEERAAGAEKYESSRSGVSGIRNRRRASSFHLDSQALRGR